MPAWPDARLSHLSNQQACRHMPIWACMSEVILASLTATGPHIRAVECCWWVAQQASRSAFGILLIIVLGILLDLMGVPPQQFLVGLFHEAKLHSHPLMHKDSTKMLEVQQHAGTGTGKAHDRLSASTTHPSTDQVQV